MSENKEKRPAATGSKGSAGSRPAGSRPAGGGKSSPAGRSGTSSKGTSSKSAPSKGTSSKGTPSKGTPSKGTSSKGVSSKSAPSKSTSSKGASSKSASSKGTSSKSAPSKGTSSKGTSSKSASSKGTSSKGASSKSAPSKSASTGARNGSAGKNTRAAQERPYNPRRDMQDERDLHNSPAARRMAEERRLKKYNKNKPLYTVLMYLAVAVAVLSVVIILSVTVLFNITEITVTRGKNVPYADDRILAACGVEPGDNLFAVDAEQAALAVTTELPYIEVCNIYRKLPSTLELDVHAAVPLGRVTTTDGAYIVLSASGRALEYGEGYTGPEIAHISGMDMTFGGIGCKAEIADPEKLDTAAEMVVGFGLYGLRFDSITFESAGTVTAEYDGRITVRFGPPTNLSQKIQAAANMIEQGKIAKNEGGILDLSIDERVVFTPDYLLDGEE